jgi:hypothetical protein
MPYQNIKFGEGDGLGEQVAFGVRLEIESVERNTCKSFFLLDLSRPIKLPEGIVTYETDHVSRQIPGSHQAGLVMTIERTSNEFDVQYFRFP